MDRELDRLTKLYEGKTNDELLMLSESSGDLTDVAQEALGSVIRERKLVVATPGDAKDGAAGADAEDELDQDETTLWDFDDLYEVNTAIRLLEGAGIPYRLIDHSREAVATRGQARMELVVSNRDLDAATQLLHEEMGLFPGPEGDAPEAVAAPLDDLFGVLVFDSEREMKEGLAAAQALGTAGISYLWHDGRDSPAGLADAKTIAIEVSKKSLMRARAVVEAATRLD